MARALPPPTREQQAIVDAFAAHNVLVDAVAGSGKTTTILSIVATFPSLSFLVLTYNARLRHETRQRALDANLRNAQIHTYHSFMYACTGRPVYTDKMVHEQLKSGLAPVRKYKFDAVIIDEC